MGVINELVSKMEKSEADLITFHKRKKIAMAFSSLFLQVREAASFLRKRGWGNQTVLGIIGRNDLEWIIADLACIYCGVKLLPLERNADFSQHQSDELKFSAILVSSEYAEDIKAIENAGFPCILLDILAEASDTKEKIDVLHVYDSKEVLSYKATSGSTGAPKIIGHNVESVENSITGAQAMFKHAMHDRILVFLPLNLLQQRYWIYSAIIYQFTVIVVPKEYVFVAIRQDSPTVIMGVPFIYELIYENFKASLNKSDRLKHAYREYIKNKQNEHDRFEPFNEFLGGNIRYLWTGSAPIAKETVDLYFEMGVPLYQGYGMNETCIIAKNCPAHNKTGSVGKLFPAIELKFDESNQIIVKSEFPVCSSYAKGSDGDKLQTFLPNGYIATGDIGYMDKDGFLFINGRVKDMITLSSSKKIFPRSIEEKLETYSQIAHCILYGDNKPYLVALFVPSTQEIEKEAIQEIIKRFNEQAKEEEKIIRFAISFEKFSEQNKLLSNQSKIKRQAIYENFHLQFESLYKIRV